MHAILKPLLPLAILATLTVPATADEIEETIEAALEAYRAGDVKAAKEEIDFVSQLLGQLKAEGLKGFLPAPLTPLFASMIMPVGSMMSFASRGASPRMDVLV